MAEAKQQLLNHFYALASDFDHEISVRSFETRCEVQELIARAKETMAASHELIAEADRLLALIR